MVARSVDEAWIGRADAREIPGRQWTEICSGAEDSEVTK